MRASPEDRVAPRRTETSGTTTHAPQRSGGALQPGLVLGERYAIREQLGRGGMGVVWLAHDLKLRVEVALKAIRPDHLTSKKRRELLRAEVRAAREVLSPNVCRVFDLVVVGDQELVSMEYVEGVTLAQVLEERAPLEIGMARDLAAQFLAGLEAVHQAGLVHRDFKPDNIMVTPAGRVVVMDLGIAQRAEEPGGTVVGTPAYMAPEQSDGGELDARADVFAAAMTLAEMTMPTGDGREALLEGLRSDPPRVPEGLWSGVIRKALSRRPVDRYPSVRELSRAIDNVALRVSGEDDRRPYPGLAAFGEADAAHFFGREAEVEALLRKLAPAARLLAIAGPSGAGKSSFVRAGLVPALPEGWRAVVLHPGDRPFAALAAALVPELPGDAAAMNELVRIEEPEAAVSALGRWRNRHARTVLIVDQFEELFTLCTADVQARFAALLGRLPVESDVHVLASMRDDFLMRCYDHGALEPIASELTLLRAPSGAALRRALVQPALACGHRFEDETLVDEMLAQVEKERAALPLLAFTAARLWEERDRDQGLLTREAYRRIGGVAGALAQHAEATLGRIGVAHEPVVRELFRNLVTAEGTRAARDRDELLSVFDDRATAAEVLGALIDARLLTSYEPPSSEGEASGNERIEIVHESLLAAWPRLVRWRTQDADGARLRDQLRQAARLWDARGRPEDLLWTGTSYREFELWRERYEGRLTDAEEGFAGAMMRRTRRRRRHRRLAFSAVVAALVAIVAAVTVSRQQAVAAARRAETALRHAEAQKLFALGQAELERSPTEALAFATRSLQLADSHEARMLALRSLAAGPPARVLPMGDVHENDVAHVVVFSPSGDWAALVGFRRLEVVSRDGRVRRPLAAFPSGAGGSLRATFDTSGRHLYAARGDLLRIWTVPEFQMVEERALSPGRTWTLVATPGSVLARRSEADAQSITSHSVGAPPEPVVRIRSPELSARAVDIDSAGRWLAYGEGGALFLRSLVDRDAPPRRIGRHRERIDSVVFDSAGRHVAARDTGGEVRIWPARHGESGPLRILDAPTLAEVALDHAGDRLVAFATTPEGPRFDLWDLTAPPEWQETRFSAAVLGSVLINGATFSPEGAWLATGNVESAAFWPLAKAEPRTLIAHPSPVMDLAFTSDGGQLVSVGRATGSLRLWAVAAGATSRVLARTPTEAVALDLDAGSRFAVVSQREGPLVVPLDGGKPRRLRGFEPATRTSGTAIDRSGRLVAASSYRGPAREKVIRIWDLEADESWSLGPTGDAGEGFEGQIMDLAFRPDGSLVSVGDGGLRVWSVRSGTHEVVAPSYGQGRVALSGEGRYAAHLQGALETRQLAITDLEARTTRVLSSHGNRLNAIAVDGNATTVVSGDGDGVVRVGPLSGDPPHLLLGHSSSIESVAISPDGRWIGAGGADGTIRLWPMPNLESSPLQALPQADLVAALRSLTNVRVVEDAASPSGWKVDLDPFPGWAGVPAW